MCRSLTYALIQSPQRLMKVSSMCLLTPWVLEPNLGGSNPASGTNLMTDLDGEYIIQILTIVRHTVTLGNLPPSPQFFHL